MMYKINNDSKYQFIVFLVLMTIILSVYICAVKFMHYKKDLKIDKIDDVTVMNDVEDIILEDDKIYLSGWVFQFNNDTTKTDEIQVLVRNIEDNKEVHLFQTERNERDDVNKFYECEYDYLHSGFVAAYNVNKIDLKNKAYEIFVRISYRQKTVSNDDEIVYNDTVKTVSTGKFIKEGKLVNYNPLDFQELVTSEKSIINDVVNNGDLLTYSNKDGLYIYQYNNKLYWIALENFYFDATGKTQIAYHLVSSRIENLPVDRQMYGFDDLSFYFENNEYHDATIAPYRMAVIEIPTSYPIAYIAIGGFDSQKQELGWGYQFQPKNEID